MTTAARKMTSDLDIERSGGAGVEYELGLL